ncbi:sulfatase-like hydrolase/transferase [Streptomyces sp. NPDC058625]|uniref:sulfatase-like hydrolase/transferase n=1 Tax=Streptomyces sp. NPDC058625 TaxID=3346564 RepID=UPI0036526907
MTSQMSSLSRRRLLGAAGAAAGAVALTPSWASANAAQESEFAPADRGRLPEKPNILVILADDLGWADLSCYGAPEIRTPHLDRLALSGIRFTDGYAASPLCSPTRFGLYTGRYPGRLAGGLAEPIVRPNETDGIPLDRPTLAGMLKEQGYTTRMFGKWHCGYLPWFSPTRVGWDEFFGAMGGAVDYFSKINPNGDFDLYENEVQVEDLGYFTDLITDRTVDFIREKHRKPWLANVNFTTPHWPWEGPKDVAISKELTARTLAGETGDNGALAHWDGGSREVFKEMVEGLDAAVGKILEALDATGQRRNTVVLFTSDNGGERWSNMWPLYGNKGDTREGGVRVPAILSWPGTLPGRKVSSTPVITMDWTATFVELGAAAPDPAHPFDGVSLVDHLLRGKPAPGHDLFWRMRNSRALRRGDWKFYYSALPQPGMPRPTPQLYNLAVDQREFANLATKEPRKLSELVEAWEAINATLLPYPPPTNG